MSGGDNNTTTAGKSNKTSSSDNNKKQNSTGSNKNNGTMATGGGAPRSGGSLSGPASPTGSIIRDSGPSSPTPSVSMACDQCAQLSQLELEAFAAVREVAPFVRSVSVSEMLTRTPELLFLNLVTLENESYCIELTQKGWRICSDRLDCMYGDFRKLDMHVQYYETIYALLDSLSKQYRDQFSTALAQRLGELQAHRDGDDNNHVHENEHHEQRQNQRQQSEQKAQLTTEEHDEE